jgi:2'-5' RNA ligase
MTQQLSLDGISADSTATDFLFLGIFFAPPASAHLTSQAQQLRSKYGLMGRPLAPNRFHISLFDLGHSSGLNVGKAREAIAAAATVKAPAFDVTFASAMSFGRNAPKLPLVLRMAADTGPLVEFHKVLGIALTSAGLGIKPRFTPHITLLYDAKSVAPEPIDPIHLRVNQFTLVHSLQGETQHVKLGQWMLQG